MNYIVIEITHDTAMNKPPFARIQKYAGGQIRLYSKEQAKDAAKQAINTAYNGVTNAIVEKLTAIRCIDIYNPENEEIRS